MTDKEFKISLIIVVAGFLVLIILMAIHDYKKNKVDNTEHITVQEEIAQNTLNDKISKREAKLEVKLIEVNNPTVINNSKEDIELEIEYDELEYLGACVEAEAGTQGLMGKRLVVDVILNRVDSDKFPNTITDVIDAPGQFAVVSNGSINKVDISQETFKAIELELKHRTDSEILYFRADHYGDGKACYKVNNHYFSK
jgi:N-acetylmuramoyl-L-alanine amidase